MGTHPIFESDFDCLTEMSDYCFVITGCTAGLGLALLERLISEYPSGHFIAICRNKPKAERVFKNLIEQLKKSDGRLDVVVGDNGDLKSIQSAATEIQKLTNQIDALYLNAGTMGNCRLDWKKIVVAFCTFQFIRILVDSVMGKVFPISSLIAPGSGVKLSGRFHAVV